MSPLGGPHDHVVPPTTSAAHAQNAPSGLYGPTLDETHRDPYGNETFTAPTGNDYLAEDRQRERQLEVEAAANAQAAANRHRFSSSSGNKNELRGFYPSPPQSTVARKGFKAKSLSIAKRIVGEPEDAPETVSTLDYVRGNTGSFRETVVGYFLSLFPFIQWLPRYNLTWLAGDLIAGITVGIVLVPQSLSYAKLATLPIEYGLYSAFIGVLTYPFFATSKDVSIGPVAVMSLQTANVIAAVQKAHPGEWSAEVIATALAFICGFIVLGIGLLRLGWLIEFIPQPAVSGFMTGSAINIAAGQIPSLFGISNRLNTRAATYEVIINTLKNLHYAKLDAAYGVTALFTLYLIKWSLQWAGDRYAKFRRASFFLTCFRHAFVIVIWTIIAWRQNVHLKKPSISLLGHVPRGLQHVGQPYITPDLLSALAGQIPVSVILLVLEHCSIAKSFGRLNGYKINPNQELIAIGVNNTLGSVFNAYPSTGSFSRSALKSKAGVRTPAGGIPTGIVVIIALYALTSVFYWIPSAVISALIIHAVADLVASPKQSFGFWRVAPLEWVIFVAAVLVSLFSSIDNGIYTSLAASVVLLLFRIARPRGHFLGRVRIRPEGTDEKQAGATRDVYVPMCGDGGITNPQVKIESPPAGVIIYRFEESFLYPNASYINQAIIDHVKARTRRGKDMSGVKLGDRNWNDPGPKKGQPFEDPSSLDRPLCRAVILDFAAVANLDTTGVQNLIDLRREVEKYADQSVEFHFAAVLAPWTRRALIAGGFGYGAPRHYGPAEVAPALPPIDILSPADRARQDAEAFESRHYGIHPQAAAPRQQRVEDAEAKGVADEFDKSGTRSVSSTTSSEVPLLSQQTPFFHYDLASAIAAVAPGE